MTGTPLGKTLVIANPAAQSGRGAEGAQLVEARLRELYGNTDAFAVSLTERPLHAVDLAAAAQGYETVVALGGDGVIHEVVNGLMKIDAPVRPRLGLVPLGSGNDYANTLGVVANKPLDALEQLLGGTTRRVDLGLVNGTYFDNTLSFGLDAAIAADTVERRKKTGAHGVMLFAASGVDVFMNRMQAYRYTAQLFGRDENGGETCREISGSELIFAVQVGPTYGGGFLVAPGASPTDGLFDLCYTIKEPNKPFTLALFLSAKFGLHVHSSVIRTCQVERLVIEFPDGEPPSQVDGEVFCGSHFDVRTVPQALEVVVPAGSALATR